jgi:hypothetical protein
LAFFDAVQASTAYEIPASQHVKDLQSRYNPNLPNEGAAMSSSDNEYLPKNRTSRSDLGPIDIEISGRDRKLMLDPNRIIMAVVKDTLFPSLGEPLPAEEGTSILSGRAGYRYSDCDVEMILDREELDRFIRHDLSPEEYFKLRDHFGEFHPIEFDFYDPETGEAIQPVRSELPHGAAGPGR